jgi:hypothetical protein
MSRKVSSYEDYLPTYSKHGGGQPTNCSSWVCRLRARQTKLGPEK